MKLTKIERLTLINQFKILEALYEDEADYYKNHRTALEEGFELHYEWIFEYLSEEEMSSEECREVIDILNMYRALNFSYIRLKDKSLIDEDRLKFDGFDGNNETKQLIYVRYFLRDLNRFEELHDKISHDYNSHSRMLPEYREMLDRWSDLNKKTNLTQENIMYIIGD